MSELFQNSNTVAASKIFPGMSLLMLVKSSWVVGKKMKRERGIWGKRRRSRRRRRRWRRRRRRRRRRWWWCGVVVVVVRGLTLGLICQGTVVLRVNIRLVILTRKGRGIESQSFYFFFVLNPIRRGGLVKKNVSLRKWAATKRDENAARGRRKTGRRFRRRVERNQATRPRGLMCKSGLVIGYWNDNAEWIWFASKKAIEWLTPSKDWWWENMLPTFYSSNITCL